MADKKKAASEDPDPLETEVQLHVPPKLYQKAQALYEKHPRLFSELVRGVFARDELFGIKSVKIVGGKGIKPGKTKGAIKKTCDIGPLG